MFFALNIALAQNNNTIAPPEKESDGYLVYFEPDVSQNTIDSLLDIYNSYQVWITPYSKIRYWKVLNFPFYIDTIQISQMNDLYDTWINDNDDGKEEESGTNNFSYNYKIEKIIQNVSSQDESQQCTGFYTSHLQGQNNVIVDILDTGFDFNYAEENNTSTNISGNYNFITNTADAQDDNGHGTHITTMINSLTLDTVNRISMFESKTHNNQGIGKLSDIIRAIDHSIDIGADIINASWSFYAEESSAKSPLQIAIETAGKYGILFVTSAGNNAIDLDNNDLKSYPASYPCENILTVSANACDTSLSYFSNYGYATADICAIGENVPGYILNGQMVLMSGTSQSTAYVSAMAAILGTYFDEFDPLEIKTLLLEGAKYNDNLQNIVNSEGIVDIENSLSLINQNTIQYRDYETNKNNLRSDITKVYPNPFNEELSIDLLFENKSSISIELYNSNGKLIKSDLVGINKGLNSIKIKGLNVLKPGIYYIKAGKYGKKLLKIE